MNALAPIFERSRSKGTARLVLLALAWKRGDEITVAVSVATLHELTRASRRAVQMALRELEELGEISPGGQADDWAPTTYRLDVLEAV